MRKEISRVLQISAIVESPSRNIFAFVMKSSQMNLWDKLTNNLVHLQILRSPKPLLLIIKTKVGISEERSKRKFAKSISKVHLRKPWQEYMRWKIEVELSILIRLKKIKKLIIFQAKKKMNGKKYTQKLILNLQKTRQISDQLSTLFIKLNRTRSECSKRSSNRRKELMI